eukprot:Gregarina_sp_Pseudo_9__4525@NODE_469_length_2770_cov_117_075064_g445_i0_p1_GENE_NODE_469_length_2770_cov_117_075064_g445_i0NODE_469_length_2770_cov_117_075064_g445_i0_p1_ORF_typecomplete_len427_score85_02Seipin/PF06775_14/1_8e05_NODE_469_length_2770_cov_117_075064_g445_i0331313
MHERRLREVKRFRVSSNASVAGPQPASPRAGRHSARVAPHSRRSSSFVESRQDGISHSALARNGIVFSAVTLAAVIIVFWVGFFMTLTCLWGLKAFYVPPKILNFPIPLDYDPFMRSDGGSLSQPTYPVYEMKNPPALFAAHRDLTGLSFDEDSVRFQAATPPEAIVGFTDLRFNISGLLAPMVPKRGLLSRSLRPVVDFGWRMLGVNRHRDGHWGNLKGYPAQMVLEFLYNPSGFRAGPHARAVSSLQGGSGETPVSWLANTGLEAVDFRVVLYTDQGQKVLQMVNVFFPEQQSSRLAEALAVASSTLVNFFLSLTPFSFIDPHTNWKVGRVVLVENLVLPSMAPHTALNKGRYVKVRISPKLPIRNLHLLFQSEVRGITALLQNYPTLMPFTLALASATLLAIFALILCSSVAIVLSARSAWIK